MIMLNGISLNPLAAQLNYETNIYYEHARKCYIAGGI